jgi:hypothetical protein
VLLNPVAVSVHPVGGAGTLASVLGLATLGSAAGGLFTAAGRRASLTTSPARLTLFRGGVARVRRLDATLTPPGGVPVTLALWGSADAGDAAAFDARVGVPVKALRAGSMAARALAPPGAGDDDVLAVRLTRADRPALDWRAAARNWIRRAIAGQAEGAIRSGLATRGAAAGLGGHHTQKNLGGRGGAAERTEEFIKLPVVGIDIGADEVAELEGDK